MNALLDRISIDLAICGGKPCIKGTRLWVSLILDFLANGVTEAELVEDYPPLTHQDIMAAFASARRCRVSGETTAEASLRSRYPPYPIPRLVGFHPCTVPRGPSGSTETPYPRAGPDTVASPSA